jgi:hypothetical protein
LTRTTIGGRPSTDCIIGAKAIRNQHLDQRHQQGIRPAHAPLALVDRSISDCTARNDVVILYWSKIIDLNPHGKQHPPRVALADPHSSIIRARVVRQDGVKKWRGDPVIIAVAMPAAPYGSEPSALMMAVVGFPKP